MYKEDRAKLEETITPSTEALTKFQEIFGKSMLDGYSYFLFDKHLTLAIVTEPMSVIDVKQKLKRTDKIDDPVFYADIRVYTSKVANKKFIKVGKTYYNADLFKNITKVLGKEVKLVLFEENKPLFIFNEKAICVLAPYVEQDVDSDAYIDIMSVSKLRSELENENNSIFNKLDDKKKIEIINRLALEIGIKI
jgi:hypothetical protein